MPTLTWRHAVIVGMAVVGLAVAPVAAADPPPDRGNPYPLAEGNFTSPDDPGWVYFIVDLGEKADGTRAQFGCGIGPDGTVGCDTVPHPQQIGTAPPIEVPPGTNQTVATPSEPASFRFSEAKSFTRDVDILTDGHRLVNGEAYCGRGFQGSMTCHTGEHGFAIASIWGENW